MFDDDAFGPGSKKPLSLEAQLENASVEELEARIQALKTEIQACEQKITAKRAQRSAADSVFGRRPS
ncbi:MAG: DUF1192 domain-containing protein [Caulobacterales bacterium]